MAEDTDFGSPDWRFGTTPWSDIISAKELSGEEKSQRLNFLARRYWKPVYNYIRRSGKQSDDAGDLTQAFFSMILDSDFIGKANPERGRFRNYIITALKRFLTKDYRKKPDFPRETLFVANIEEKTDLINNSITPEKDFDRNWARTLINNVGERLREYCKNNDDIVSYEIFHRRLVNPDSWSHGSLTAIARELNMDRRRLDSAYRRALRIFRCLFRQEVRTYVTDDSEVDEEIYTLWKIID